LLHFGSVIGLVQSHLIGYFAQRLQLGLILDYGRKLLHLPLSYFENRRSGEVATLIADVDAINNLVAQLVLGLPSRFFIAVISLGLMLFYSWQLTLASIATFIIITILNLLFLPAVRRKNQQMLVLNAENQGYLVETFRGAQVLKTTQATLQAWEEYQGRYGRLANIIWQTMKLELYTSTITQIVSNFARIGILWLGSCLVINHSLTFGQLMAYYGMSGNFLGFLSLALGLMDEFLIAQVVMQRLNDVIDATPENHDDFRKAWVKLPDSTDITFSQITFHHIGRIELLEDFSVMIPGGITTALIGSSGCGKSTLAKMMAALYLPQSGNIRYDNYNQQDLALESLRQQVVLVPQEAHFWSRSIADNFRLSYPYITFEQIVCACQLAGADEFISQLPEKYQTILGEFGANLSGGQRQRLAIARAIATNPPVLILDESTAALDPVNEAQVLNNVLSFRRGKTTILISHRPKVIEQADWIVLLEKGKVKISGTPDELRYQIGSHLDFLDKVSAHSNGNGNGLALKY
jgi:ABC-type bacteriocin/lantibiotic exporter with double-glycine peptidase domain